MHPTSVTGFMTSPLLLGLMCIGLGMANRVLNLSRIAVQVLSAAIVIVPLGITVVVSSVVCYRA